MSSHVLVIEDEPDIRKTIDYNLSKESFEVIQAASIEEGEKAERPEAGEPGPDDQRCAHADIHADQSRPPAQAVGDPAEHEAAGSAADTDHAQKQCGSCGRRAAIRGVGDEMDEGHENAEGRDGARQIELKEGA